MRRVRVVWVAGLLIPLLAAALFFAGSRRARQSERPAATQFRSYLADPTARMVAYSPAPDADAATILQALTLLRERFDGLSLYGCDTQTVTIVAMARRLHFRAVLLTVWDPRSESELAIAASLVRDSAHTLAMAVSIGSEGLMQNRYSVADMNNARAELMDRNTDAHSVEMTTSEPWWLYLKPESAELRSFGEFTSVNVHVVWDTDIQSPALAASWTRDRAAEVQHAVERPLLLRECGFPGGGDSPREGSSLSFTRAMQRDFWVSWLALKSRPATAVFEGIDNEAKHWRGFEGKWGLLQTNLAPWPAWSAFPALTPAPVR